MSAFASANDAKTVRTVQSIKKSMNKLEALSQMNWSKRDVPADIIAPGSLVFNRVHTTNDPLAFSIGKDISVQDNPLNMSGLQKKKNQYTVADQEGFKA
jgi:hypothetical protein